MNAADLTLALRQGAGTHVPTQVRTARAKRHQGGYGDRAYRLLPLVALAHLATIAWLATTATATPDRITIAPVSVALLPAPIAPVESVAAPPAMRTELPTPPPPESRPPTAQPPRKAGPVAAEPRPRPAPAPRRASAEPTPAPATLAALDVPQLDPPVPDPSSMAGPQSDEAAATTTAPRPPPRTEARFDAAYLANPRPAYPALSRRLGEQGKVLLRVRVAADGNAAEVTLHSSSGFVRLDRAAIDAVSRWRFVPARLGEEAIASWVQVPIAFTLEY